MMKNTIYAINGPVVKLNATDTFKMLEMVYVGPNKLIGEVISISDKETIIQVYETTQGLKVGDEVYSTGELVSIMLGPGLMGNIYDGVLRPLQTIEKNDGHYIKAGSSLPSLDLDKTYEIEVTAQEGTFLSAGMSYGKLKETKSITHRLMIPPMYEGIVKKIKPSGIYKVRDSIITLETKTGDIDLNLYHIWPIKKPRPVLERLELNTPLITGQRVIDTFFPIAKGGTAAIPGGFGTGKTMLQHQLAKWSDADIIVYIGCGERGNEMTQVLDEFTKLVDPRTNETLMDRTILIANTSNMPVAAREASIYTGLTVAEYYRDMGYHVAIMADSTSRWAEALREISARLEEIPAEEGYPSYLPSRISKFYERAGMMVNQNRSVGSVSIIGAVSPQGADFSEPVTQNTKRFVRAFWALDKNLAYQRHFAAINWNLSYSEYINELSSWYDNTLDPKFLKNRSRLLTILAEENKLLEIASLMGSDVLPDNQKLTIEIGRVIRTGFLQQNAFHKVDTFVPLNKQLKMMDVILYLYDASLKFIEKGKALSMIIKTKLFDDVIQMKYEIDNENLEPLELLKIKIRQTIDQII
ncbi:V-type ATP synthase subunit A [Acholeplasma granularum]|uniref:V-type ATP synthase subunit A n=1 Tax=Acholeplasma granularum TaxID=264635 RepID=UPI0004721653